MSKELAELDRLYQESEECDKPDFAEMRTSLLMINGDHYNKRGSKYWDRIRSSKDLSNEVKIRLTKNHLGKIAKRYSNVILSSAPGVMPAPRRPKESKDRKAAELCTSIWAYGKEQNNLDALIGDWADDFTGIGEVWSKFYFDQSAGNIIAYEVDENGVETPIYEGAIKIEQVLGFNVLRSPVCKNVLESPYLVIRKMVPTKDLKKQFAGSIDEIKETEEDTFMVFESNAYRPSKKGETLVREWYFRPCAEYPNGWYAIHIRGAIVAQGELPGGIFPIQGQRFDYVQTKARGIACTKPLRPCQIEINRSASKMAEHQLTLGDDKLVLANGAKLSAGVSLPGIRTVTTTGAPPTIIEGRTGAQYLDYMLGNIKEMYQLAEIDEDDAPTGDMDAFTLLFRAGAKKQRFQRYVSRFELFLKDVCQTYLKMARYYLPDSAIIQATGAAEAVNIAEFKQLPQDLIRIKLEPQTEDLESKMGRQLSLTHILQYVGNKLPERELGKIIKMLPYANVDESFSELTSDYESAENEILALDRGETPLISEVDNHEYIAGHLTARMKKADFKLMHPFLQQGYKDAVAAHMQFAQEKQQALARANSGFIPDGGTLIGVDYFVQDPNNPERTRRARLPYASVEWLVQKLKEQGAFQDEIISQMPDPAAAAQLAGSGIVQAEGQNAEIIAPSA
jgi:hypothetical protein